MNDTPDLTLKWRNSLGRDSSPKLDFAGRCRVLALRYLGVRASTIAAVTGVSISTVRFIYRDSSKWYKDVREHCSRLGQKDTVKAYLPRSMLYAADRYEEGAALKGLRDLWLEEGDLQP